MICTTFALGAIEYAVLLGKLIAFIRWLKAAGGGGRLPPYGYKKIIAVENSYQKLEANLSEHS
ncbi:MAG: hypothetical protein ACTS7E_04035 [Arsenophonus sp. NC-CH8-MAG3]